jgi:methionine-rich copper-binding protein CopC
LITVVLATVLMAPSAASAHSQLRATAPAASATVTAPINEVTLTFNEPVHQRFSTVVVDGPGGLAYSDGPLRVVDSTVHQAVYPLKSGSYLVRWRVVSADGHPMEGSFGFTVALPAQLEPSAGPPSLKSSPKSSLKSSPEPSRVSAASAGAGWSRLSLWLVGLGALAVGSILAAVRFRSTSRRRS